MADLQLGTLVDGGKPFRVPESIATQTIGILGQKGSGKSNTEVVLAEAFFAAGIPWVAIEPKGDWYGIRSSRDGSAPGLPIPVLGGLHGDVPLAATEGAQWADVIVDSNLTAVVDVSDFSKNERARFLVDFFDRLYRRHRQEPQVRHVFLEEAHEYIPQMVGREEGRLKEAAARIVLQGRSFGLGCSACSQRSARLHKDVLTQIGTLIAHRTTGPQDRKAIEAWVIEHDLGKELVASLPELHAGEAWVWSPEFLGSMDRVQFRPRQTFDSGATPAVGAKARQITTLADVDLAAIKEQMAESVERAKADDPKLLRKRITELERHLRDAQKAAPEPEQIIERVEVPVLSQEAVEALRGASGALSLTRDVLDAAMKQFATPGVPRASGPTREREVAVVREAQRPREQRVQHSRPAALDVSRSDPSLGKAERAFLTVLAQYPDGRTRDQVAIFAGYSVKSRHIDNTLAALRSAAYIEGGRDHIQITTTGLGALGDWEQLPTGSALISHFKTRFLGKAASEFLDVVLDAHPSVVTRDEIAERAGYSVQSRHVDNTLAQLRSLQLISGGRDGIRLNDEFAEAIA